MAVSSSVTSSVTRTSYAFDTLCNGSPCCVCDAKCLLKLTKNFRTTRSVASSLYKKLNEIIHEIEVRRGCQLVGFSIGRAPINKRERTKRKGDYYSFDIMDPRTWNKDALKLQWEECKRSDCGRNGLIVLTVVTQAETPINYSSHEEYVIKIEEELRSYSMFERNDNRLQITSFSLQKSKGKAHAYAIYVAIRLLESSSRVWKGGAEEPAVPAVSQYISAGRTAATAAMHQPNPILLHSPHTPVQDPTQSVSRDRKSHSSTLSSMSSSGASRKTRSLTYSGSKSSGSMHTHQYDEESKRHTEVKKENEGLRAQISQMSEVLKSKETELEIFKEENMQVKSQLHHMEAINQAKLKLEEENKELLVQLSLLVQTNEENESKLRKVVKENSRLSKSPKESHQIKVIQEESRQLKLQLSEMAELSKARETELERVKEENAQLNSQLHHNVEKIHRAKLVAEEENERLKAHLSELVERSEANDIDMRKLMEENSRLKTTNVRKSPEEKNEIKMIKKENRHLKAQVSELVKLYQVKETELNEAVTKNALLTAQLHDVERIKEATVLEEENTQLKMQLSELIVKSEANEAELRRVMEENVQLNAKLHLSLEEREQTTTQFKRQFSNELERVEREKEKVISELQEKLQMKDAESAIYVEDFNSERVDRERIHSQLEDLREEFAQTKERMLIERQRCEQLAEENVELSNEREKAQEDIQVLTAQVNAYSREVDKQKGLVTQSQEKHKTEVDQLRGEISSLREEINSLRKENEGMKAANTELMKKLKSHKRTSSLTDNPQSTTSKSQNTRDRQLDASNSATKQPVISPVASLQGASINAVSHSNGQKYRSLSMKLNRTDVTSSLPPATAITGRTSSSRPKLYNNEIERAEEEERLRSEREVDAILLDVDHTRKSYKLLTPSAIVENGLKETRARANTYTEGITRSITHTQAGTHTQASSHTQASEANTHTQAGTHAQASEVSKREKAPYDPNLVCPKCGKQYRVGGIQKLRRHINERCTGKED
uniref:Uncharacterized protein n=1 Tax=Amphimedon queenslandica TaxID=400682 RepID=A0A1X7UA47_AMPQE